MQNDSSELSFCPSFNIYSSDDKLLDIAATVSRECRRDDVLDDQEFEFFSPCVDTDTSSFPIFNRDLPLNGRKVEGDDDDDAEEAVRIPLRNLFIGDRDIPSSSSSSSEADELEGVPSGTYCAWTPKQSAESSPNRCKKSKSTGSSSKESKRWRLKDLLKRCNSDGKVCSSSSSSSSSSFLVLDFEKKNSIGKKHDEEKVSERTATTKKKKGEGEVQATKVKRAEKASSAHEVFYVRSKAMKEGDKRRSYLPYRQDLVGVFANVHGFGRTFPPF